MPTCLQLSQINPLTNTIFQNLMELLWQLKSKITSYFWRGIIASKLKTQLSKLVNAVFKMSVLELKVFCYGLVGWLVSVGFFPLFFLFLTFFLPFCSWRVLEASIAENKASLKRTHPEIWSDSPNPYDRKRQDNCPVGLKNVGNTCWFSAVIQVSTLSS